MLIPRKSKDLVPDVAKEMGLDEELVQEVVIAYWEELKKSIVEMRHYNINVYKLGRFKIKRWKLDELIDKYMNIKKYLNPVVFRDYAIIQNADKILEKAINLSIMVQKEDTKKLKVKERKNEKISKGDMA